MTTETNELIAKLTSFIAVRRGAKAHRDTLDVLKEPIGEWLDQTGEAALVDPDTGNYARWVNVSGGKQLAVEKLDDQHIIWAARRGLLQGNIAAIDAAGTTDEHMVGVHYRLYDLPGYRKLDIGYGARSWQRDNQEPANLQQQPAPPAHEPTPISARWDVNNPTQHADPPANNTQAPAQAAAQAACPTHGAERVRPSKFGSGGLYCTGADPETEKGYCKWTKRAS